MSVTTPQRGHRVQMAVAVAATGEVGATPVPEKHQLHRKCGAVHVWQPKAGPAKRMRARHGGCGLVGGLIDPRGAATHLREGRVRQCPARIEGQRLQRAAPKGVELYSWQDPNGRFRFSLLWGTNRNKTEGEIRAPDCVLMDVPAVEAAFGRLAQGEHVFWANDTCPKKDCRYPPTEVVEGLDARARDMGVALEGGRSAQSQ